MVSSTTSRTYHSRSSRSHHERRDRPPEAPPYEKRIEVDLIDLDGIREGIRIGIKKTTQLTHVAAFLRRKYRYDDGGLQISEGARILFYWPDKCLVGNAIPSDLSALRYRILSEDEDDSIQLSWSSRVHLEQWEADELKDDIAEGKTLGVIRRKIASYLQVDDPHRVVVSAQGGFRPGQLQGDNWETSKIATWLCRRLFINLVPPDNYVVFKGINEEYVCHPPAPGSSRTMDFRALRKWLRGDVLTNCHRRSSSCLKIEDDDIRLIHRGKLLNKRSHIAPGQTVDFELARSVEDEFVKEESWLVPLTEICMVCSDDKRVSEMPRRVTAACEHDATTCNDCVGQWIVSSLDTMTWDRLRCPECPKLLRFDDVRRFASNDGFARYDSLATKAAVAAIRDFKWCLNSGCNSGQIMRADCSKVKCHACRAVSCSQHNVPWHRGETCEQYDRRTRKQRKIDKASETKVKEITKACPQCHLDVQKYSGCDHITCICGHEWCYICLETYFHDRDSLLQCKHKTDCKYFTSPPLYEGDRAFRPWRNSPPPPPGSVRGRPESPPFRARGEQAHGGIPRRPFPNEAPAPAPRPVPANANPFQFTPEYSYWENRVDFNFNEFLGAAAIFTLEQLMQRAR